MTGAAPRLASANTWFSVDQLAFDQRGRVYFLGDPFVCLACLGLTGPREVLYGVDTGRAVALGPPPSYDALAWVAIRS